MVFGAPRLSNLARALLGSNIYIWDVWWCVQPSLHAYTQINTFFFLYARYFCIRKSSRTNMQMENFQWVISVAFNNNKRFNHKTRNTCFVRSIRCPTKKCAGEFEANSKLFYFISYLDTAVLSFDIAAVQTYKRDKNIQWRASFNLINLCVRNFKIKKNYLSEAKNDPHCYRI